MAETRKSHLIKMVNQIATNLESVGGEEEAVNQVAEHLRKFWPVAMQRQLTELQAGDELCPVASRAIKILSAH